MSTQPRSFHQAEWNEPIIMEMGNPGERGVLLPQVEPEVKAAVGDVVAAIPAAMRRKELPRLPELGQPQVLRHYLRLSQETLGTDINIDIGHGTCTEKYSPKINEVLARLPEMTEIHPLQAEDTVQGILEIMYRFEQMLKEISGMDRFSLQPGGGGHGIYTNAAIIRAYHASRGEAAQRTEIISSILSHPTDAAAPATAGFKVIYLYPGPQGYAEPEALKAVVSERTAGFTFTNPEDTGVFNPQIDEMVRIVHRAGGLCAYDQANENGLLGIAAARDAGFDLCQFNLHKTFSAPHGSIGPAAAAVGARQELAKFLPVPLVEYDGQRYWLDYDLPESIGKVRSFQGVPQLVLKSYAWVMSLGAAGLLEAADLNNLNNLYLIKKLLDEVPGISLAWGENRRRIGECRVSWEKLKADTGVGSADVQRRMVDFGVANYFMGHHPFAIPEPAQLEPSESYSKADIDEFVAIFKQIAHEAYTNPEIVKTAPHNSTIHEIDPAPLDDPERWAITWRAYQRKAKGSV